MAEAKPLGDPFFVTQRVAAARFAMKRETTFQKFARKHGIEKVRLSPNKVGYWERDLQLLAERAYAETHDGGEDAPQ
jgi:hypothetical protein